MIVFSSKKGVSLVSESTVQQERELIGAKSYLLFTISNPFWIDSFLGEWLQVPATRIENFGIWSFLLFRGDHSLREEELLFFLVTFPDARTDCMAYIIPSTRHLAKEFDG